MCRIDQVGEILVGAEVRVDGREIEAPVPVVGGAALRDGLLLEHRRDPERREAEVLDPLQALREPLEVAAVEVAGVGRVEPGCRARAGEPAGVVRLEAVRVPVRHHEVDAL